MSTKWGLITTIFILFFMSLSFVSASDLDNQTMSISNGDIIGVDDTSNYKSFDELGKIIYGAKEGDTIILNDSYINTNSSTIKIDKSITLNGNGFTIDGNEKTRIFTVTADNVVLKNLKFVNGANTIGGAISWSGNQGKIENCIFDKNTASSSAGGALYWGASNGQIINSNFTNNNAQTSGGVVSIEGDNFLIEGNMFNDNTAKIGGAIRAVGNSHKFLNNEFTSNFASTSGGAIRVEGNDTTITNNNFNRNTAEGTLGGAVIALGNNINIANNKFTNNIAKRDGGAIDIEGSVSDSGSIPGINNKIENNVFTQNSATYGGAISFNGKLGTISENNFTKNHASELGGAIRWVGVSDATGSITNNQFEENDADVSGGAIFSEGNKSTITGNTFKNNKLNEKTGGAGGAMNIHGNECVIENNKYISNTATLVGGAINYEGNNGKINKNSFHSNKVATASGGAIYISGDSTKVEENNFTKNVASGNLGGAIAIDGKNSNINSNNFTQNTAKTNGGAAYIKGSGSIITNNNFDSNTVENTGGALRIENGDNTKIDDNTFNKNIAKSNGGAINVDGAKLTISSNKFYENQAQNDKLGGAIWFKGDGADINSNTFNGNTARTGTAINGETSGTKIVKNTFLNSEESDKTLIRLDGNNNDVSDNIYKKQDRSTKITINDVIVYYGRTAKIVATLTDSDSQALPDKKVTINFIDKNYELTTDTKGQVSINVKDLSLGTYKATATFAGDDEYDKNTATATVTVKSTIESKDLTAEIGNVKYNATFLDSNGQALAKGEYVSFTVEGDVYRAQVGADGVATATFDKRIGEYSITSTNTVTGETAKNKLKITEANPNLKVSAKDIEEGSDAVFDITANTQATGNVTLNINNINYQTPLEKGKAKITVSNLTAGKYQYTVTYAGNDNFTGQTVNGDLNVKSDNVIITAQNVTKYYGGSERLTVSLTDKTGAPLKEKTVWITINKKTYNRTTDDKGIASMALNLPSGNYTADILFKGDADYKAVNTTCNVVIKATVFGQDLTKIEKASKPYVATFLDSAGKPLAKGTEIEFNINGIFYKRTIGDDGKGALNINLVKGKYTITATNLKTGENTANTVIIESRIVNNTDVTKYYKNDTQYYVTVLDDNGNPVKAGETVTFNINGVFYQRTTNDKGVAELKLNLPPSDYVITAEYKGCRVANNIKILPVLSAKDLTKKYGEETPFIANLVDGQGKPLAQKEITFNINGVFYYKITEDTGMARLNINLLPGQYIITSSYNGVNIANRVTVTS